MTMKSKTDSVLSVLPGKYLSTSELASSFGAEPQTPRASLCKHGHWMGMVPVKLPNGRLRWSVAEAAHLRVGGVLK